MINPFKEVNWTPDGDELRKFGWTILVGFSFLAVLLMLFRMVGFRGFAAMGFRIPCLLLCGGAVVLLVSHTARPLALPLYRCWFFLSCCVGIVVSNLILLMFFYLFFSPFAVVFRLFTGRDPLCLRKPARCDSYWHEVQDGRPLENYLRQY